MVLPDPDNPFSNISNLADRARDNSVRLQRAARARRIAVLGGSLTALIIGYLVVFVVDGWYGVLISLLGSVLGALIWTLGTKVIPAKAIELVVEQMSTAEVWSAVLAMIAVGATVGPIVHAARAKWPTEQTLLLMVSIFAAGAIGTIITSRRLCRAP